MGFDNVMNRNVRVQMQKVHNKDVLIGEQDPSPDCFNLGHAQLEEGAARESESRFS